MFICIFFYRKKTQRDSGERNASYRAKEAEDKGTNRKET